MAQKKTINQGYVVGDELSSLLPEMINPYEERLQGEFHYEIRIGDTAWVSALTLESRKKKIIPQEKFIIPSGREAIIRSKESFTIPSNYLGKIDLVEEFPIQGLLLFSREILEPGSGLYVYITVSNISDSEIEVERGDTLANFYLIRVSSKGEKVEREGGNGKTPPGYPEYPRILEKEIATYPELVADVHILQKQMEKVSRNDRILVDIDLKDKGEELFEPFAEKNLSPVGYMLGVGSRAEIFFPQRGLSRVAEGKISKHISNRNPLVIPPGYTALVRTNEKVKLQKKFTVVLSPTGSLTKRYLNFDGRVLPPGYQGYVWCNIHNYGTVESKLECGDAIIHARVIELGKSPIKPIVEPEIIELPENEEPNPPTSQWDDLVSLTDRVDKLEKDVKGFGPTKQIIELIFMAGVAAILVGLMLNIFPSINNEISEFFSADTKIILYVFIVAIYLYVLLRAWRKKS